MILALTLQGLFLALAFGLRTAVHLVQTRSTGFRAFSQHRTAPEIGGVLMLLAAGVASFIGSTGLPGPIAALDHAWLRRIGASIAICAIVVIVVAQFTMGRSWRIGVDPAERTELITTGIFAFVRNPIFTGMIAFWIGVALVMPSVLTLAAPVIAWVAVELQVRGVEEPYLLRVHGAAYRAYAARTGRLIPGVGKLTSNAATRA